MVSVHQFATREPECELAFGHGRGDFSARRTFVDDSRYVCLCVAGCHGDVASARGSGAEADCRKIPSAKRRVIGGCADRTDHAAAEQIERVTGSS